MTDLIYYASIIAWCIAFASTSVCVYLVVRLAVIERKMRRGKRK